MSFDDRYTFCSTSGTNSNTLRMAFLSLKPFPRYSHLTNIFANFDPGNLKVCHIITTCESTSAIHFVGPRKPGSMHVEWRLYLSPFSR